MPRTVAGREPGWQVDGVASKANAVARVSRSSSRANRVIVDGVTPARCAICRRTFPGSSSTRSVEPGGALGRYPVGLEAAHVRWHSQDGPDVVANGLALCCTTRYSTWACWA